MLLFFTDLSKTHLIVIFMFLCVCVCKNETLFFFCLIINPCLYYILYFFVISTIDPIRPGLVSLSRINVYLLPLSILSQFVGYSDEVLDVKFLGKDDSHIVVATNSCQLKVFELLTNSCQILYGHTG